MPFNRRVAFSETRGLASLAQKGVLRKHLCQLVCRRRDGLASKVFAAGFSLAPAVTVGYGYMQDMLLNLLQMQAEQWQLSQKAAILACGVEICTTVLQTSTLGHSLLDLFSCAYLPIQLLLHDGRSAKSPASYLVPQNSDTLMCTALLMVVTGAFHFALCSMELIQQKRIEMGTLL